MLAVIMPLVIPDPSRRVPWTADEEVGMIWPVAFLGERVTLFPLLDAYMMNIEAPDIWLPVPIPTHPLLLGPVICRKTSPLPEEEVESGMLIL
jgi:hypothetical protein